MSPVASALEAPATLALAVAVGAAAGCTWLDSCFRLLGFAVFGRRFMVYLVAALTTTLAPSAVQRYGVAPEQLRPFVLAWAITAQSSLLTRRIARGSGRAPRPSWVSPIPGLETLLFLILKRLDDYDNLRDNFRLNRRLWHWSRRLYDALGSDAAAKLAADYIAHLTMLHSPTELVAYTLHGAVVALSTPDDVYRLLAEIVAKGDNDYVQTLPYRIRFLCKRH